MPRKNYGKPSKMKRDRLKARRDHPVFDVHPGDREPGEDGRKTHPRGKELPPKGEDDEESEEEEEPEPPELEVTVEVPSPTVRTEE